MCEWMSGYGGEMPRFYPGASLLKEWYLGHRYPLPLEVARSGEECGYSEALGPPKSFFKFRTIS